jgi:transglutaminase-like putative cysteine protease
MTVVARIMSIAAALALLSAASVASAGQSLYSFAPAPRWVVHIAAEYDAPLPAGGVSDGEWNLLMDRQFNATANGDDFYEHSAVKVTNASGVDDESQININVDPTFQTLSLHSIRVVRGSRSIDQQRLARITALPQETELRNRVYDGSYNINILLADVRVGDVVEYEYTVHSAERLFPGLYSDRMTIGWSVPMRRQRLRILAPVGLALEYRATDRSEPISRVTGGLRELTWEWHDLPAIEGDDDRPSWYAAWPYLEVSNSKDWAEVARRVAPLFQVSNPRTPGLQAAVAEIRNAGGTPADQALRALQFVQEQIRYVSISIGQGGYRPSLPERVLERRFGDCKDKSLLLATLLRQLGIDAQPALVNTRRGRVLDSSLPTPYAFNHAVVRMRLGNDTYWLDGTRDTQFSPISSNIAASFDRALVIDGATTGLAIIPREAAQAHTRRSEVRIDMRAGLFKPAKLQITTFYEGRSADSERQALADQSDEERRSNHLKYIVRYFPRAKVAAPITVHDDRVKNVVELREYYEIDRPFETNKRGHLELFLQANSLNSYVTPLKSAPRTAPFSIGPPVRIQQTITALLPLDLSISNETVRVDNPAFNYQSVVSYSKEGGIPQVTLTYRYESLTDFVDVAAFSKYQEDRKRAFDDLGYYIRPPTTTMVFATKVPPTRALAEVPKWVAWASLCLALWVGFRFLVRWDPLPARSESHWPVGIRGWLLIPAVDAALAPALLFESLHAHARFLDIERWAHVRDAAPESLKTWVPGMLLVFAVAGICLLVAEWLFLYLFFKRRTSAPRVFIVVRWSAAVYSAAVGFFSISAHLAWDDHTLVPLLVAAVVVDGAYTAYFLLSKRVKATFIVRRTPINAIPFPATYSEPS